MLPINQIIHGDCLEVMPSIPNKSIDMILCDLPYGTTQCKWDSIIPFDKLWLQYKRIIKEHGVIVLTSAQPFTSALVMSNPNMFKYNWLWNKVKPTGHLNAKKQPLRIYEDVLVFYKEQCTYNPIMIPYEKTRVDKKRPTTYIQEDGNQIYGTYEASYGVRTHYYPNQEIKISNASQRNRLHPTQKPVELFEYLIKTYTNEGDLVLDNCIGSGTTAVACIRTNRKYIGIELDEEYYKICLDRISKTPRKLSYLGVKDDE